MTDAISKASDIIKEFEGLRLKAYLCPAGIPTIGYGATGPDIELGMEWTREEAERDLEERIVSIAEQVVNEADVPLSDSQLAALISFVYNVGIGRHDKRDTPENEGTGFRGSTLLRRLNEGDYGAAADQFARWNKSGGKVTAGLVRRRAAERELFLSDA